MCGITGYSVKNHRVIGKPARVLNSMMAVQKHRGPDDSGYAIIDRVNGNFSLDNPEEEQESLPGALYFGFNRLSILDLSRNGHQPMYNPSAGVAFMLNGEIYNAFDYVDELKSRGHIFKSNTDTEVASKSSI